MQRVLAHKRWCLLFWTKHKGSSKRCFWSYTTKHHWWEDHTHHHSEGQLDDWELHRAFHSLEGVEGPMQSLVLIRWAGEIGEWIKERKKKTTALPEDPSFLPRAPLVTHNSRSRGSKSLCLSWLPAFTCMYWQHRHIKMHSTINNSLQILKR